MIEVLGLLQRIKANNKLDHPGNKVNIIKLNRTTTIQLKVAKTARNWKR